MQVKKTAQFITDFYGSAPAGGTLKSVLNWIDDRQMKGLMSFVAQTVKKGEEADQALERILSVFHRDSDGLPVIGNWMLQRCFIVTGQTIFNAMKDKTHPKKDAVKNSVLTTEPIPFISIKNGKVVSKPNGIETYAVSIKTRSFFKAYEYIRAGATFEFTACFDGNLISEEHINMIIDRAGSFGLGAFRERFGKFKYI